MSKDHPDYIVVEGPIGVGKTTLAKRLAKLGLQKGEKVELKIIDVNGQIVKRSTLNTKSTISKIDLDRTVRKACQLVLQGEYFFFPSQQPQPPFPPPP